jgi:prepilin-type N-terminal cleavage/methylation domain-containing protein
MTAPLQKRKSSGFTIIEVMIVLAIAGLILAIVFLAVPALQRTSRNTQRKNDVSALLSGVSNYEDNNAGSFPAVSGTYSTEFPNDTPNLGYYTIAANVTWKYQAAATAPADPADLDKVVLANYAKCNGNAATTTGATARSVVAVFDVEGSGGAKVPQCTES